MSQNGESTAREQAGDQTAAKLAGLKAKTNSELSSLAEKIDKEIIQARDWPPSPMVSESIKQGVLAIGSKAVKLITALEKADAKMSEMDKELKSLRGRGHEVDSSEVAHLRMENKVLKEHIEELSKAADGGKSLKDENVDLRLKLENLEAELNRLLVQAADAQDLVEENDGLKREINELTAKLESQAGEKPKTSKSGRLLASIWETAEADGRKADEDPALAAMKGEAGRLREELEKTKKKANSLKAQNENLSSKVMELAEAAALRAESAMEEINSLREERGMLEQERDRYRSMIENRNRGADAESGTPGRAAPAAGGEELDKLVDALKARIGELEEELDQKEEEMEKQKGEAAC